MKVGRKKETCSKHANISVMSGFSICTFGMLLMSAVELRIWLPVIYIFIRSFIHSFILNSDWRPTLEKCCFCKFRWWAEENLSILRSSHREVIACGKCWASCAQHPRGTERVHMFSICLGRFPREGKATGRHREWVGITHAKKTVCTDEVGEGKEVSPIRLVSAVQKATQDSCRLVSDFPKWLHFGTELVRYREPGPVSINRDDGPQACLSPKRTHTSLSLRTPEAKVEPCGHTYSIRNSFRSALINESGCSYSCQTLLQADFSRGLGWRVVGGHLAV